VIPDTLRDRSHPRLPPRGHGYQFLVQWKGYGHEDNEWLAGQLLEDCKVLDKWYEAGGDGPGSARYLPLVV